MATLIEAGFWTPVVVRATVSLLEERTSMPREPLKSLNPKMKLPYFG